MKAGAVEFLVKPFSEKDLLDAIQQAIKRDQSARYQQAQMEDLCNRYESLTPRQRQVMESVVSGLLNKQVAAELGISSSDQLKRADCLILDIRMSGMSGIELQRQLVANHSEVPVIFITAHEEETERVQALEDDARTVLIKPFSEETLLSAISKALTA
jgi:FixJ family two-component response regulator